MPTFSCPQCGATLTASHKPNACSQCGGRQMRSHRSSSQPSSILTSSKAKHKPSESRSNASFNDPNPALMTNFSASGGGKVDIRRRQGKGLGLGVKLFDPGLIMTWLLVLSPLAVALGFVFYRLASFQLVSTGFVHRAMQEEFNQPSTQWRSSGHSHVADGQLRHRQGAGHNQSTLSDYTVNDSAMLAEISAFEGQPQGKVAGIMSRVQTHQTSDGYYLAIRDDGHYSLGIKSQGKTTPKIDWKTSQLINTTGQVNRLELISNGNHISGLINGVRVGSFQDPQFEAGTIAVFSENAGSDSQEIGFNKLSVRVKEVQNASVSPQRAIINYYQDLNQQPDTDGWQWVFRTEIYDTKILKEETSHTAIQVGLRYHLRNGEKICESRVFTLTSDENRQNWRISRPKAIRSQPNCTL